MTNFKYADIFSCKARLLGTTLACYGYELGEKSIMNEMKATVPSSKNSKIIILQLFSSILYYLFRTDSEMCLYVLHHGAIRNINVGVFSGQMWELDLNA